MSSILNKLKIKKEKNKILTNKDLENYKNRLYKLKDLTISCLNDIKINPKNQKAYDDLNMYSKEIKQIKKILKCAKKVAKNSE